VSKDWDKKEEKNLPCWLFSHLNSAEPPTYKEKNYVLFGLEKDFFNFSIMLSFSWANHNRYWIANWKTKAAILSK